MGYVNKLNSLVQGTHLEGAPLSELVLVGRGEVFNNAAQIWNHDLFFHNLKPDANMDEPEIPAPLLGMIERSFGSYDNLVEDLRKASADVFGSGWLWVCWNETLDSLYIQTTPNAETPFRHKAMPIIAIDLWEHAYYLDYKNKRSQFVDACIRILDWEVIYKRLEAWRLLTHTGL